ncbi:hypothetical protein Q765_17130 [Flavobacterium rivuli WB 3.3-2 = DSM 21788]|uniref:DUF4412 domain-containing protein n=1 Tax=Flavobacterium rivuli WB 3.3-2 = DSM 21788 TaxID=1121895 RepID=A0A0A2M0W5_9FLAO|nr:hypothetical protein [Flavobacterium rivuli]KGO85221.1 hypothetical protein Q765_17130 [Flavobacterium rivuli WB 3.3-2 = DSM 21788]
MKKIILFLALALSTASFAQIKKVDKAELAASSGEVIGKIEPFAQGVEMECVKNGNTYTFTYKDYQYKTIDQRASFSFEDIDNAFEDFYKTAIDAFETKPKESIMIETKDQYIFISYSKTMGIGSVSFKSTSSKASGAPMSFTKEFNKKQIEKLFGKKK